MTGKKKKSGGGIGLNRAERQTDLGTPEARRHGCADVFYARDPDSGAIVKRARVTVQVTIDRLLILKTITHRQWQAGDRLRTDIWLAGLVPRVTVNLLATGGGGQHDIPDRQADAHQREKEALRSLSDRLRRVVMLLLVSGEGVESIGRRMGWSSARSARRNGQRLLCEALDALADFYGIAREVDSVSVLNT